MATAADPFGYNQKMFSIQSQVARLLATENIRIRVNPGSQTATFDTTNRVLTLPLWEKASKDLMDMLMIHEVGHALDTKDKDWKAATGILLERIKPPKAVVPQFCQSINHFIQIIEDIRIDKRQRRRYPGTRNIYKKAHQELYKRDFFRLDELNIDVQTLNLIDRMNLYFKGGDVQFGMVFSAAEQKFIDAAVVLETWNDVLQLVEDVYRYDQKDGQTQPSNDSEGNSVKNQKKSGGKKSSDQKKEKEKNDDGDSTAQSDDDDSTEDDDGSSDRGDETTENEDGGDNQDESTDDTAEDGDDTAEDGDQDGDQESSSDHQDGVNDNYVPEVITDTMLEESIKGLVNNSVSVFYKEIPSEFINCVVDFEQVMKEHNTAHKNGGNVVLNLIQSSRETLSDYRLNVDPIVSYMVKQFEMRKAADTYARTFLSSTGELDMDRVSEYRYSDELFRQQENVPEGKNHGLIMFLDWSASMKDTLSSTIQQVMALVFFCRRVQIPFEVYIFRTASTGRSIIKQPTNLDFHQFAVRNILSSRMDRQTFEIALLNFWLMRQEIYRTITIGQNYLENMGSTPLNGTLLLADTLVNQFQKRNRIDIVTTVVLTDGDATDNTHNVVGVNNVIHDPITKKDYPLEKSPKAMTNIACKILKDRTNCNLIGFFLGSPQAVATRLFGGDTSKKVKEIERDGFIVATEEGFDEYYGIRVMPLMGKLNLRNFSGTMKELEDQVLTQSKRMNVNRVLLNRFVASIASRPTNPKKV